MRAARASAVPSRISSVADAGMVLSGWSRHPVKWGGQGAWPSNALAGVLGRADLPTRGVVSSLTEANLYTAHPANQSGNRVADRKTPAFRGRSVSGLIHLVFRFRQGFLDSFLLRYFRPRLRMASAKGLVEGLEDLGAAKRDQRRTPGAAPRQVLRRNRCSDLRGGSFFAEL